MKTGEQIKKKEEKKRELKKGIGEEAKRNRRNFWSSFPLLFCAASKIWAGDFNTIRQDKPFCGTSLKCANFSGILSQNLILVY